MSGPQKPAPPAKRNPRWHKAFIGSLRLTGNVTEACRAARVDRTVVYDRRRADSDFASAWDGAVEESADLLELEARRRAYDGVDEPVIYQGELMGLWVDGGGRSVNKDTPGARQIPLTVKRYSDTLMTFLLKGTRPEKYGQTLKLTGTGKDGEVLVKVLGPKTSLSDL